MPKRDSIAEHHQSEGVSMRQMLAIAVMLALTGICGLEALADIGDDVPPIVHIYDVSGAEPDSLTVQIGEMFTLIGMAAGHIPIYYYWHEEGLIGTGNTLTHSFAIAGEHVITLEAVDVNGLSGFDSVLVVVMDPAVSTRPTTWGCIKSLFR
jgi:hypothetical protein